MVGLDAPVGIDVELVLHETRAEICVVEGLDKITLSPDEAVALACMLVMAVNALQFDGDLIGSGPVVNLH